MVAGRLPAMSQRRKSGKRQSGHRSERDLATAGRWGSLLVAGRPREFLGSRRTHEILAPATIVVAGRSCPENDPCSRVSYNNP
ncbi:hypothetical protein QL285_079003 [Trifolium repens]|nr:hypothetical protein QL285_079003 [Trifolium repens]